MKKIFKFLIILTVLATAFSLVACNNGGDGNDGFLVADADGNYTVTLPAEYTAEFGVSFALPVVKYNENGGKNTTVTVVNPDGTNEKLSYNSFKPNKVGTYVATYKVADGDKTATTNIVCRDTVAPEVEMIAYATKGTVGDLIELPRYKGSDRAGIDEEKCTVKIVTPSGVEEVFPSTGYLLEENGFYTVKVTVFDNNGLSSVAEYKIDSKAVYHPVVTGTTILDFNNDDYLNLVSDVQNKVVGKREIVKSGYPAITGEDEDNAVMKITSDATFNDVWTNFVLYDNFKASTAHRIVFRIAVSTDTDYVKIYKGNYIAARLHELKAGEWYELELNPLDFGYNKEFTDFDLVFRDKGDTALFVDEVYYTEYPFEVSQTLVDQGVYADFDDEGYLDILYQNMYNEPTTTRAFRVGGTKMEITDDYPAPNNGDGMGATGKVFKFETDYAYGGWTYMFPEVLDTEEVFALKIRMYMQTEYRAMIWGMFDESGDDPGETVWYTSDNVPGRAKEWIDVVFAEKTLKGFSSSGKLSGIFVQFNEKEAYNSDHNQIGYVDSITVLKKGDQSDYDGETITDFSTDYNLKNVFQLNCKKVATMKTTWNGEAFGENDGAMKLEFSSVSDSLGSNGFYYVTDEKINSANVEVIGIKQYIAEGAKLKTVTVMAGKTSTTVTAIKTFNVDSSSFGSWNWFGVTKEDLLAASLDEVLIVGLRYGFTAEDVNNVVYIDEISIYNHANDDSIPVLESVTATDLNMIEGDFIGASSFVYRATDLHDPMPDMIISSVTGPDCAMTVTDGEFAPVKSGEYTIGCKAKDHAGNLSEEKTVTLQITLYDVDDYPYLDFAGESAIGVLGEYFAEFDSRYGKTEYSIVYDEAARDNFAAKITLNTITTGMSAGVSVALPKTYRLDAVSSIKIGLRALETSNPDLWPRIKLNGDSSDADKNNVASIKLSTYQKDEYTEIVITKDTISSKNANGVFEDVLSEIIFCHVSYGHSMTFLVDYIDIEVDTDAPVITGIASTVANIVEGDCVGGGSFGITATDDTDTAPVITITGASIGGVDCSAMIDEDGYFTPEESGTYALTFVATDKYGHASTGYTADVTVTLYDEEEYPYLDFIGESSLSILDVYYSEHNSQYGKTAYSIVYDEAARDNFAAKITLNTKTTGVSAGVKVKLPKEYDLKDVLSIKIGLRALELSTSGLWPRIKLNGDMSSAEANTVKSIKLDDYKKEEYTEIVITKDMINSKAATAFDEVLSEVIFCHVSYGHSMTFLVDYVDVSVIDSSTQVNVTFDYQGGSDGTAATKADVVYTIGENLADKVPTLTKEGTRLVGWTNEVGNGYLAQLGQATESKTFYAVWYDEDWLKFDDKASNFAVSNVYTAQYADNGAYWDKNLIAEVVNINYMKGAKIMLPKVDVAKVGSITFKYKVTWNATQEAKWPGVWINTVPTDANGYAKSFSLAGGTSSEYITVEITGDQVRAAVPSGTLDYLTLVNRAYASTTMLIKDVVVTYTEGLTADDLTFASDGVLQYVSKYYDSTMNWKDVTSSIVDDAGAKDGKALKVSAIGLAYESGVKIDLSSLGLKLEDIDSIVMVYKADAHTGNGGNENPWKDCAVRLNGNPSGAYNENVAKNRIATIAINDKTRTSYQTLTITGSDIATAIEDGKVFGDNVNLSSIAIGRDGSGWHATAKTDFNLYIDSIVITTK